MLVAKLVVRVGDQHARLSDRAIAHHNCFEVLHIAAEMKLIDEGWVHAREPAMDSGEGREKAEEREWRSDRRRIRGGGERDEEKHTRKIRSLSGV
jgi:hypothetical protein